MVTPYSKTQLLARELRGLIDDYSVAKIVNDLLSHFKPYILMCKFSPAVKDNYLYFVASIKEVDNFFKFDLQVVLTDLQAEPHLLDIKCFGVAAVFLQLFGALVVVFAPIDYLRNRRIGIGRYFD